MFLYSHQSIVVFNPINNRQPKTNWKKGNLCTLWENAKKLANTYFYIHVGKDGPKYTEFMSTDHEDCIHFDAIQKPASQTASLHKCIVSTISILYPNDDTIPGLCQSSRSFRSGELYFTLYFNSTFLCFSFEKEDQGLWNHQIISVTYLSVLE